MEASGRSALPSGLPPIPAGCRSTRTASWWAASASRRTAATASTGTSPTSTATTRRSSRSRQARVSRHRPTFAAIASPRTGAPCVTWTRKRRSPTRRAHRRSRRFPARSPRWMVIRRGRSAPAPRSAPPARYLSPPADAPLARYLPALRDFLGDPGALTGAVAWSARAVGNVHRPTFPDGIEGTPHGALSTPFSAWSPFNVGFQLDLVYNQFVKGVLGDTSEGCAGRLAAGATPVVADSGIRRLRNGAQIFPGAVPIYRGTRLAGAIGVSGDGVDQDDMIASLCLANAARRLAARLGPPAAGVRADTLTPMGVRLRYVQCPQAPFNGSDEQNACAGL